jgi:hypothetical protein
VIAEALHPLWLMYGWPVLLLGYQAAALAWLSKRVVRRRAKVEEQIRIFREIEVLMIGVAIILGIIALLVQRFARRWRKADAGRQPAPGATMTVDQATSLLLKGEAIIKRLDRQNSLLEEIKQLLKERRDVQAAAAARAAQPDRLARDGAEG